jgi:hypothetical protein
MDVTGIFSYANEAVYSQCFCCSNGKKSFCARTLIFGRNKSGFPEEGELQWLVR